MNKQSKTISIIIGIIVLIIVAALLIKRCNTPSNQTIDSNITAVDQKTQHIILNDSTKGISQDVLVTHDPELIKHLTDSISEALNLKIGLKPQTLIQWKDKYIKVADTTKMDSLSKEIDKILAERGNVNITDAQFEQIKKDLYAQKIPFNKTEPFFHQSGHIDYNGNLVIDTLQIQSGSDVSIGETRKNIFSHPKIAVVVRNTNPLIQQDSLKSIVYIPPTKSQISFGPMILANKAGDYSLGAGISIKRGIFSFSLGYELLHNKN